MKTYDIAIIGGGIAGLSLAYFLSPHRSVAVLEREDALGYHSTGRSAAEFVLRYNAPEICALARVAKSFFDAPPAGFSDVPLLKQRGGVMIANAEKAGRLEEVFREELAFTPELERLSPEEAIARAQEKHPEIKARCYLATGTEACWTGDTISAKRYFPAWVVDESSELVVKARRGLEAAGIDAPLSHFSFCTNGSHFCGEAGIPTIG